MGALSFAIPLALLLAACGGGGGRTADLTPQGLSGSYEGIYVDPDGVSRQAWLKVESEPNELSQYRTILTVYPGTDRIDRLPQAVQVGPNGLGSSVVGTSIIEGSTVLFTTPGAWSRWLGSGGFLVRPPAGIGSAFGDHLDASFPQKVSSTAATLAPEPRIVRRTFRGQDFVLHVVVRRDG